MVAEELSPKLAVTMFRLVLAVVLVVVVVDGGDGGDADADVGVCLRG